MSHPKKEDFEKADEAMEAEAIYRDLLLIADIVGKKANYAYLDEPPFEGLYHWDVGCNFVHAHEGFIDIKNNGRRGLNTTRKELKKTFNKLKNYFVHLKNGKKLRLDLLATMPRRMLIPTLHPRAKVKVDSLISVGEIDSIEKILAVNMVRVIGKDKDSPLISRY